MTAFLLRHDDRRANGRSLVSYSCPASIWHPCLFRRRKGTVSIYSPVDGSRQWKVWIGAKQSEAMSVVMHGYANAEIDPAYVNHSVAGDIP